MARASGLTVRTLRHYDEIGLVSAGERTASGHRRYTEADLMRLYRVRALRGLGLSLEQIAAVLHGPAADNLTTLRDLLTEQLRELTAHAKRITRLRKEIGGLLAQLTNSTMPDPVRFMTALEMVSAAKAYFTEEQRDFLHHSPSADTARTQTLALLKEIRQHQLDGTPVDDPRVQTLTRRVDAIGTTFGGDERLIAAANRMWRDRRVEISRSLDLPVPDEAPDIVDYLQQARQARSTSETCANIIQI